MENSSYLRARGLFELLVTNVVEILADYGTSRQMLVLGVIVEASVADNRRR